MPKERFIGKRITVGLSEKQYWFIKLLHDAGRHGIVVPHGGKIVKLNSISDVVRFCIAVTARTLLAKLLEESSSH